MKNIFKTSLMALAGLVMFAACDSDRDSNPVLLTGDATFHLNAPEVGNATVDLAKSTGLALTWNQPVLTTDNAPLGTAGSFGFRYVAELSKNGNFTTAHQEGEENTACDYTVLSSSYSGCSNVISSKDIDRGMKELYGWEAEDVPTTGVEMSIRMVAQYVNGFGVATNLAYSNVQKFTAIPVMPSATVEVSYLWVPGNAQNWDPASAGRVVSPEDNGIYTGFIYVDGGFKFTVAPDWAHGDYGFDAFTQDVFTSSDDGNLVAEDAGLYYVTVNLNDMTLSAVKIENMNLVGDFNGWNQADDAQQMTWDAENMCFVKEGAGVTDAGWKFAANNDWGINLGGDNIYELVQDGSNLSAVGSTIKLYPCRTTNGNIYCTVE